MPDPTGSPALSAEELDRLRREHWAWLDTDDSTGKDIVCCRCGDDGTCPVLRLMASLDAALADVARERERADNLMSTLRSKWDGYSRLKVDRDRLAARVVSLEEACRRAIGAYDNDKNLDNDRYQLRLEREMENLIGVLRGAGEEEVSDGAG